MAKRVIDIMDGWMGRMPGRLSELTLISGTVFAILSGSTIASSGTLGKLLISEMENRGYRKSMAIGPIMGVGGLAMVIPPCALAVVLGSLVKISIGKLLVGGILPGLLMAAVYLTYIIGRCHLQPSVATSYSVNPVTLSTKVETKIKYAVPQLTIIAAVLFFGIATPTKAAALGAIISLILCAIYGKLNWNTMKLASQDAVEMTVDDLENLWPWLRQNHVPIWADVEYQKITGEGLEINPKDQRKYILKGKNIITIQDWGPQQYFN